MTKIERFEAVDRCLFWKEKKILVVGDLHLGYEDYLAERGWSFPKTQIEESINVLEGVFKKVGSVKEIILLGDVKHYFAGVLNEEFSDFKKIAEFFKSKLVKNGKIVITKGNHDGILGPILKRWGYEEIELHDFYSKEDVVFFHGNKEQWGSLEIYGKKVLVTGHFHPAVRIQDDAKSELFKCFLLGKFANSKLIILPSFFTLVEGSDVSSGNAEWLDVSNFEIFVVADEVYDFGKVKSL
jgi:putative SbcD/Mre11-related phosphoesterase